MSLFIVSFFHHIFLAFVNDVSICNVQCYRKGGGLCVQKAAPPTGHWALMTLGGLNIDQLTRINNDVDKLKCDGW